MSEECWGICLGVIRTCSSSGWNWTPSHLACQHLCLLGPNDIYIGQDRPKMGFSAWAMPAYSEFWLEEMATNPCKSQ